MSVAFDPAVVLLGIYLTKILGHVSKERSIRIRATMLHNVRFRGITITEAMSMVSFKHDKDINYHVV